MSKSQFRYGIAGLILVLAVLLRFWGLGTEELWIDEGFTEWFSAQSWQFLWQEVPKFENHPPYFFLLMKAWVSIFGNSELALRAPSALAGVGLAVLLFAVGRLIGAALARDADPEERARSAWLVGLTAAALGAFWKVGLVMSLSARPYTLALLACGLMMLGVLGVTLRSRSQEGPTLDRDSAWGFYVLLGLGMVLTLWSHVLGLVPVGLTGLFLIIWWLSHRDPGVFWRLAVTAVTVAIVCIPHFQNVLRVAGSDYSNFWLEAPSLRELVTVTMNVAGQAGFPVPSGSSVLGFGFAALLLLGGSFVFLRRSHLRWQFAYLLLLPAGHWLILVLYTYLSQPVLLPRTLVFMVPPLLTLMAAAPLALPQARQALSGVVIAGLALIAAFGPNYVTDLKLRPYGSAVEILSQRPEAPVMAIHGWPMLDYYRRKNGADTQLLISTPEPFPYANGVMTLNEKRNTDPAAIHEVAASMTAYNSIWLVKSKVHGDGEPTDPDGAIHRAVLEAGWREVEAIDIPQSTLRIWYFERAPKKS